MCGGKPIGERAGPEHIVHGSSLYRLVNPWTMKVSKVRHLTCWCFLLAWITSVNCATRCSQGQPCPGARPCTRNGFCPIPAGQTCGVTGTEEGGDCDVELGFVCVETSPGEEGGVCQGKQLCLCLKWLSSEFK